MIEICKLLLKPIGENYIRDKLLEIGVLAEWIEIAVGLFEGPLDDKIESLNFLGEMMLWMP